EPIPDRDARARLESRGAPLGKRSGILRAGEGDGEAKRSENEETAHHGESLVFTPDDQAATTERRRGSGDGERGATHRREPSSTPRRREDREGRCGRPTNDPIVSSGVTHSRAFCRRGSR